RAGPRRWASRPRWGSRRPWTRGPRWARGPSRRSRRSPLRSAPEPRGLRGVASPGVTALLVAGLLGSLHCVGMCGGFALALSRPSRGRLKRFGPVVAFLAGKASTYVLLGALAGLFGAAV